VCPTGETTLGRVRSLTAGAPSRAHLLLCAALLAAVAPLARAQGNDAPLPPRILPSAAPPPPAATPNGAQGSTAAAASEAPTMLGSLDRPPNAARLAPLPEQRKNEGIEEIVVLGSGEWRLPDLGSRWRARQEAAADTGRMHATVLPLYDPAHPTTFDSPWLLNREVARIGYIDLFRVRFGKRQKAAEE